MSVKTPPAGPCLSRVRLGLLPLTFADEFDALSLYDARTRRGRWKTSFAHGPQRGAMAWDSRTLKGNHERQIYVDPAFPGSGFMPLGLNPFAVSQGILSIKAEPTTPKAKDQLWRFGYASGLLTSQPSFSQRYGYFELRAKLPRGKGLWPAFWLLPSRGGWPPELDVLEQTGGDVVLQTAHFAKVGGPAEVGHKTTVEGATTAFHTYGVLWTAERITWFIDGEQTAAAPTPPDMHGAMYLLLNLAVGGSFAGDPDPTTPWPAHFEIDYVRAYGLAETPDSESPRHAGALPSGGADED